jgi:hypothetical protein
MPDPRGLRAFGANVLIATPPARYCAPTTVTKYDDETNPSVWLEDYRLAFHNSGATNGFSSSRASRGTLPTRHVPGSSTSPGEDRQLGTALGCLHRVFLGHLRPTRQHL